MKHKLLNGLYVFYRCTLVAVLVGTALCVPARASSFQFLSVTSPVVSPTQLESSSGISLFPTLEVINKTNTLQGVSLVIKNIPSSGSIKVSHQGIESEQVGFDEKSGYVFFSGIHIGSVDPTENGQSGTNLVIQFNTSASTAGVQSVLRQLRFFDSASVPGSLSLSVTFGDTPIINGKPVFQVASGSDNPFEAFYVGGYPAPVLADLDDDGDLDAYIGGGNDYYFENIGTASKAEFVQRTGEDNVLQNVDDRYYTKMSFVDIDNDGDIDALGGESGGALQFFQNDGTKTQAKFVDKTVWGESYQNIWVDEYSAPSFTDIDDDGDVDLFVANHSGDVVFFRNNGTKASPLFELSKAADNPFSNINIFTLPSLQFVDFDNDGDADAFSGSFAGSIQYFENTGSANSPVFELASFSDNPMGGVDVGDASTPYPADIDGDGDLDIIVGERFGKVLLYRNISAFTLDINGEPVIRGSSSVSVPENSSSVGPYNASDRENEDITWAISGTDSALFTINENGRLSFISLPNFETPRDEDGDNIYLFELQAIDARGAIGRFSVSVAVTDVSEPITINQLNMPAVSEADVESVGGAAIFSTVEVPDTGNSYNNILFLVSEFPEGSVLDIKTRESSASSIIWDKSLGTVTLDSVVIADVVETNIGQENGTLAITFNSSATYDMVQAVLRSIHYSNPSTVSGILRLQASFGSRPLANLAGIRFERVSDEDTPFLGSIRLAYLAFADMDDDDDLDVFSGEYGGSVYYSKNTGSKSKPSFTRQSGSASLLDNLDVGNSARPAAVDINGDGLIDIFVGNSRAGIRYFKNTGTMREPKLTEQSGDQNPLGEGDFQGYTSPAFVDIDKDGDKDVFVGQSNGYIKYFANIGTATQAIFEERTGIDNPLNNVNVGSVASPVFTDMDRDGDYDVVIGESLGELKLYINTGSSTTPHFVLHSATPFPFNAASLGKVPAPAFADIDNDRDADLFVGSNDSNILYFRNLSNLGIQIAETNDAPKIVGTNSVIVKSAETFVQHLSVTDEEGHAIQFSITGNDYSHFAITPMGELSFTKAPIFEMPADSNGDNIYQLTVSAEDELGASAQFSIAVQVITNDADSDGVLDENDAFPNDPSEWSDSDNDGVGDNSDAFPNNGTEWDDRDGDGLGSETADNCPDIANPAQADLDNDGIGDVCDDDDDGDGLTDVWETNFGLDPLSSNQYQDPDLDGRSNFVEFLTGHSPVSKEDFPSLVIYSRFITSPVTLVIDNKYTVDITEDGIREINQIPHQFDGHKVRIQKQPAGLSCSMSKVNLEPQNITSEYNHVKVLQLSCTNRSYHLEKMSVSTQSPSIVKGIIDVDAHTPSLLIEDATGNVNQNSYGKRLAPVFGLNDSDFYVLENNESIEEEAFWCTQPLEQVSNTLKTVILLDVSSSLSFAEVILAREALKSLLVDSNGKSKLLPNQEVAIYTFDDQIIKVQDFTSSITKAVLKQVDGISRGGASTNLYGAVSSGLDLWNEVLDLEGSESGSLIVITDGKDTSGQVSLDSVAKKISSEQKAVYAIAVGNQVDNQALEQMVGSSANIFQLNSFSLLAEQLNEVNKNAAMTMASLIDGKYAVYYASPKRSGTSNLATFGIQNNNGFSLDGFNEEVYGNFNASGFSNISPQLSIYSSVRSDQVTETTKLSPKMCFSNDEVTYVWQEVSDIQNEFSITVSHDDGAVTVEAAGNSDDAEATYRVEAYVEVLGQLHLYAAQEITITAADGIDASLDNCPLIANPSQSDVDADGVGDSCDPDIDGDGTDNEEDVFPYDASEYLDSDGDGIGNNADTDDDNDGVPDTMDLFPLDPNKYNARSVKNDLNADGKSDLLWRSFARGWNFLWAMNGEQIGVATPINVVQEYTWTMDGQGDYNGDGKSDIFWRNSDTGMNFIYLMDGASIKQKYVLNFVTAGVWQVVGSGDFNGDGVGDVLWRNINRGDTWFYLMKNGSIGDSKPSLWVTDLDYKVVATGDLDGDGDEDIIWRHSVTGRNYIWLMNDGEIVRRYTLNFTNADWSIVGTGDLNGDSTDDIVLRNQIDGRNWVYFMKDGAIETSMLINEVADLNWQIANIGDFDGDGKSDFLWRNESTARNLIHLMDGTAIKGRGVLLPTDNNWRVAK